MLTVDTTSGGSNGSPGSFTFSHTVNSGASVLVVSIFSDPYNGGWFLGVTYNGVPMTRQVAQGDPSNTGVASMWTLQNPPTGSHLVNVILAPGFPGLCVAGSISFLGPSAIGTAVGTSGSTDTINLNVTTLGTGNGFVIDAFGDRTGHSPTTPGAGQTAFATSTGWHSYKTYANGNNVTMSWTEGNLPPSWQQAIAAVEIIETLVNRSPTGAGYYGSYPTF